MRAGWGSLARSLQWKVQPAQQTTDNRLGLRRCKGEPARFAGARLWPKQGVRAYCRGRRSSLLQRQGRPECSGQSGALPARAPSLPPAPPAARLSMFGAQPPPPPPPPLNSTQLQSSPAESSRNQSPVSSASRRASAQCNSPTTRTHCSSPSAKLQPLLHLFKPHPLPLGPHLQPRTQSRRRRRRHPVQPKEPPIGSAEAASFASRTIAKAEQQQECFALRTQLPPQSAHFSHPKTPTSHNESVAHFNRQAVS